jgi:hypothetical protein
MTDARTWRNALSIYSPGLSFDHSSFWLRFPGSSNSQKVNTGYVSPANRDAASAKKGEKRWEPLDTGAGSLDNQSIGSIRDNNAGITSPPPGT